MNTPNALPKGYILEDRYVLHDVARYTTSGIVYTALDKKLRIPAEVLEYLPANADHMWTRAKDEVTVQGDERFAARCRHILEDGKTRMQDSTSHIYDVFPANGTVYLAHILPEKQTSEPEDAVLTSVPETSVTCETGSDEPETAEDTATRVLNIGMSALFSQVPTKYGDIEENEPDEDTNAEDISNVSEPTEYASTTNTESDPLETESAEHGLSVKVLMGILMVGILLLLGCCVIFLTSLFRITELPDSTISLLHVPYAALDEDDDWLVTGRTLQDSTAPGMVVAEENVDGTMQLVINGETPTFQVPELTGMTVEGAAALLDRTHFTNAEGHVQGQVVIEWQKTTTSPHGMVLSQSPAAGTLTKSALVTLTVSENPNTFSSGFTTGESTTMVDLVGQTYVDTLSGHDLLICDRIYSDKPVGEILAQYPAAGSSYATGGPCYVVVSMGESKTHVPDVQFLTLAEAETVLYSCGLSFDVQYAYQSHIAEGLVAEVSPAAGTTLDYGETVTLILSGEGNWQKGPLIQNEQSEIRMAVGDTYTMELGEDIQAIYYTTTPSVVSVTEDGTLTALSAGYAVVTASVSGQTVVMHMCVEYDKRLPYEVEGTVGEKISLTALNNTDTEGTIWYGDTTIVTITADGLLTGKQAGDTLVIGENGRRVSLYQVHLTESDPETEKTYVTIAKSTATDKDKMEKALTEAGLGCTIQEETNEKAAGTVLRIQYTGYSDDTNYFFTEGTNVTLIVSAGLPTVRSIAIETMPTKTTYSVSESLVSTGLSIRVTYSDKTEEVLTKGFVTSYDFSETGRKTVAVSYGGRKTSFTVEVIDAGPVKAEIVSLPDKTQYNIGDTLDTTGLKVKVIYGDGTAKTLLSGFTTKYSFAKAGTSRVTVTIEGVSTNFDVTVAERKIRSLSINTLPTRTTYSVGDTLNTSGLSLLVQYTDDTTDTLQDGWTTQCDLNTAGTQTVTVTYGGKTATFSVMVEDAPVTAIQVVTQPKKLTYLLGEAIDLTGLELSVSRGSSSTSVTWPDGGIAFTGSTDTVGECVITLTYGGCTDSIRVSVNAPTIVSLSVQTMPDKLVYTPGETLDTTGLVLLATYEDGSTKPITEGFHTTYHFAQIGEAVVTVTYQDVETTYMVQVQETKELLSLSAETLQLTVGEAVLLKITYEGAMGTQLSYTIANPDVIQVDNQMTGLLLTGLRPGYCTITVTDGVEEATCQITVSETAETKLPVDVTMSIPHQTMTNFMPTLTFTGNGIEDVELTFIVTVSYDPAKLTAADQGTSLNDVTVTSDSPDTITFAGTITIPKDGTIDAGYILFYGTDMDAFQWTIN